MENCNVQQCKGKNWIATLMFCWFLGMYGAHRFYTGKSNSAWAMLIMSLTGCLAPVSCIWALVDGFAIALGKYRHEDGSELYEKVDWLGYVYIAVMILAILGSFAYLLIVFGIMGAALSGMGEAGAGAGLTP